MLLAGQCLYFGLVLNIHIVASQTTVNGYVGQEVKIPCGVGGSYTLPQWRKGVASLTSQDVLGVNPAYPRFSYDTDLRTLVISSAQEEDSGTYECTHTGGTNSPQNTSILITKAIMTTTTTSKQSAPPASTIVSAASTNIGKTTTDYPGSTTDPTSTDVNTATNNPGFSKQNGFPITARIIILIAAAVLLSS